MSIPSETIWNTLVGHSLPANIPDQYQSLVIQQAVIIRREVRKHTDQEETSLCLKIVTQ